jgi:glycosyltransferase involved in cell wall biosynthesis
MLKIISMYNPNVSVIITAHRKTEILATSLRFLADQSFSGSWEVVLCDDGSDDGILALAQGIFAKGRADSFRYIWQPRLGERRGQSRNNGLRYARGEIVLLVDGDLIVGPDFIRRHLEAHRQRSQTRTAVYGSRKWIFDNEVPVDLAKEDLVRKFMVDSSLTTALYSDFAYQARYANTAYAWLGCLGCNFSFVREPSAFFDDKFLGWGSEDQEFACRLQVRHGYQLLFEPMICGFHFEPGARAEFRCVRPNQPAAILQYLRNVSHFRNSYPEIDMTPACVGAAYYRLNRRSQRWERRRRPLFSKRYIEHVLRLLEVGPGSRLK